MEANAKLVELLRNVARDAYRHGMEAGQKHAELLDEAAVVAMADLYAAEFECGLEVAV